MTKIRFRKNEQLALDQLRQKRKGDYVDKAAGLRKPRKRVVDPVERKWAHAYLKRVAETVHLPYDGARESMQMLACYFGTELSPPDARAKRSASAIDLAKRLQDLTKI